MQLETDRLMIQPISPDMAEDVHRNSLDADVRRFVPDEVFETVEEARATLVALEGFLVSGQGPQIYATLLKSGRNIGYVQAIPLDTENWEIGYHIARPYTGNGYATEAVRAFLPAIMSRRGLKRMLGVCLEENVASVRVLEKCGFQLEYAGMSQYRGRTTRICRYIFPPTSDCTIPTEL